MRGSEFAAKIKLLTRLPGSVSFLRGQLAHILRGVETNNMLSARLLIDRVRALSPRAKLNEAEFKVCSQWGDDGIIQYLIHQVSLPNDTFIEFGVENYEESNTRFLLLNNNWRGLVMDGDTSNIEEIHRSDIYWRHDLTAKFAFITRENINDLIVQSGFSGALGILSIDLDGNDYWVWEAITAVEPAIVIAEYNSVFGAELAVSVPYDPSFTREKAHFSHLFWGCSLRALCMLAERKGYAFIGCNSAGNNSYFVKRALTANLKCLSPLEGYVMSRFRESRDERGQLTFLSAEARFDAISDLIVADLATNQQVRLKDASR
jgi:hypothetical protein